MKKIYPFIDLLIQSIGTLAQIFLLLILGLGIGVGWRGTDAINASDAQIAMVIVIAPILLFASLSLDAFNLLIDGVEDRKKKQLPAESEAPTETSTP